MKNNLTPKQERLVSLLVAGKSITDIAEELEINRSTVYEWRGLETVQARCNQLITDIKTTMESGLIGMYSEAVEAVRSCLKSENDQVRLKTALHLIERGEKLQPGITDPEQIVRNNYTTITSPFKTDLEALTGTPILDQVGYNQRMKELALKES